MGRLTTHVLDTAAGRPAAGIAVEVRRDGKMVGRAVTGGDGRTERPLVSGDDLEPGSYEILFDVARYLGQGFYDRIPIRVVISDSGQDYHVPLLFSRWSYATYRGS